MMNVAINNNNPSTKKKKKKKNSSRSCDVCTKFMPHCVITRPMYLHIIKGVDEYLRYPIMCFSTIGS